MKRLVLPLLLAPLLALAQTRPVERLVIEGNRALPTAVLEAVAAPWLGRSLDEAQIELLRLALTQAYVDRGFVNSGLLVSPSQPTPGSLHLRAVEGRLIGIEASGLRGLDARYVKARLNPEPDEPLNMDRLRDRFQLLLADPLIQRANARLLPAEQLGEAVLAIEVERKRPWQAMAFVNNHRPVSVGEWQAGVRAGFANLTGQGDALDLSLQQALEHGDQRQASVSWRLPLTALGLPFTQLQAGAEHSDAAVVEEPVARLDIQSRVRGFDLGLAHTLRETPSQRLALGLQHQWRRQTSSPFSFVPNLDDGEALRARLLRFWQEASWRSETQVLALRSSFGLGHSNVKDLPEAPGVSAPPARSVAFWTGQAQWVRKLNDRWQATARYTVQVARDRLLSLDSLAAGGVRSVRGYRENELVRDAGQILNLEAEWTWRPEDGEGWRVTFTPFLDAARLHNRQQPGARLSSAGLAAGLFWQGWSVDLVLAKRLDDPLSQPGRGRKAWQDEGVHVQVGHRW